jgi:hypothetical protein
MCDGLFVQTKHKFLTWLLVHRKLLTADNQAARNWPCNLICVSVMCDGQPVSQKQEHMCLHCSIAMQVWWSECPTHARKGAPAASAHATGGRLRRRLHLWQSALIRGEDDSTDVRISASPVANAHPE